MTVEEHSWRLEEIDCSGNQRTGTMKMVQTCREFTSSSAGILTIYGSCGNAKSHALCGLVNAMLEGGCEAVYVLAFDLINYIRQAYSKDDNGVMDEDAYSRLKKFAGVRFLAVDELDKVFPISYWEGKQLTQFFDVRYRFGLDEQRKTVIAMNRDPFVLLEEQYHILSRLKDGRNLIISNMDEDMRPAMKSYDPVDNFDPKDWTH